MNSFHWYSHRYSRQVLLLTFIFGLPSCAKCQTGSSEAKYYALKELKLGSLSLTGLNVSRVKVDPGTKDATAESAELQLTGVMTLMCGTQPCLSGLLRPIGLKPSLLGKFVWTNGAISAAEVESLRFNLNDGALTVSALGGSLEPSAGSRMQVENATPLKFGPQNTGVLHVTLSDATVRSSRVELADLPFTTDLTSVGEVLLDLDLSGCASPKRRTCAK